MLPKLKIAANTLVQLVGKLITAGVALLITILVARNFGVEGFGEFTKITVYVALFYLIADFGLNAIVLRLVSAEEEKASFYFANLLGLRIVLALILIFVALGILALLPSGFLPNQGFATLTRLGIIILSLTIFTQAIFTTTNLLFQKNLRYDQSVLAASLGSFLTLVLVALFVFLKAPLLFIIFGYLFGGLAMASFALFLAKKFLAKIKISFQFFVWKKIFLAALPLGLTLIFNLLYFRGDIFILTFFRPTAEVGIYGLAYKFFEFPLTMPIFFMNSLYPVMLDRYRRKPAELASLVRTSSLLLFLSSLGLFFLSWFLAPLITFIKPEFSPSILAFRILILSLPLFFLSAFFMWVLITLGRPKLLLFAYSFSLFLNLVLNLIFIPRFGYLAAAVITGLTEGVVLGMTAFGCLSLLKNLSAEKTESFSGEN